MNHQAIDDYLSSHAFFEGMDSRYIKVLANLSVTREMNRGDVLFHQGEHADKFYLVRSGRVSVQVPALSGPILEMQTVGENQLLGWSWLIPPYQWNFMARIVEDSNFLEFDAKAILAHCEKNPEFGYELLKRFAALMSERLNAARQKMMDQWDPPGFS